MILAARIVGTVLVLFWVTQIVVVTHQLRRTGMHPQHATVFQFLLLPVLTGLGMLAWGNWWFLLAAAVQAFLALPLSRFFWLASPLVHGILVGARLAILWFGVDGWGVALAGAFGGVALLMLSFVVHRLVATALLENPR